MQGETAYLVEGENLKCVRHSHVFPIMGTQAFCPKCIVDPAPPPPDVDDEPVAAPKGCLTSEQIEIRFVAMADFLDGVSKDYLKKGAMRDDKIQGLKAIDMAMTALARAGEFSREREDKEHTRRLERLKRRLASH